MSLIDWVIFASSTVLRASAYIFLRWIPGHPIPKVIFTALAVYLLSALPRFFQTKSYTVISDQIDIVTRDTVGRHEYEDDLDSSLVDGDVREPPKELDVEETIVLEENEPRILRTLLTGIPSPASLFWSFVTAAINLALVFMVLDLVYRGPVFHEAHDLSFARLGFVSDKTAKVLIREPKSAQYPVFLSYRYADSPTTGYGSLDGSWKSAGSITSLDNLTDFTGTFDIDGLRPDTRYQYAVSSNHSGFFTTAPPTGHTSLRKDRTNSFTFLHSSCIKPNFPYVPFRHALSIPGFEHLARVLPALGAQFMLFLGDFIYIDVPKRFGTDIETYRREYRQVYASPNWPSVSSTLGSELPWIHVYDDHEIANDWDRNTTGVYASASDPWNHYHASVNPPSVRPGASYYSFIQGPASFFMIDTRRYREPLDGTNGTWDLENGQQKSMLGTQQRLDLLAWLSRTEPAGVRWKILVTSIPFTKNWRFGSEDTWGGYLGERQVILEAMWDVGLKGGTGVIVLSGDRHEFAATAFPPPAEGKVEGLDVGYAGQGLGQGLRTKKWPLSATVHEFSVSPLSMFYLPVRTYRQDDDEDVCIKYLPDGNSKFGALTMSSPRASDQSLLHYRLFVDGEETWSYTLTTPPAIGGSGKAKDAIWG